MQRSFKRRKTQTEVKCFDKNKPYKFVVLRKLWSIKVFSGAKDVFFCLVL